MKKFFAILLIVLLAFTFFACAKGECDLCGDEASLKSYEDGKVCKDCYDGLKELEALFEGIEY
ncbi:MAG: DUF4428 domain-containing protein [Spirochaetaceae bacterium]|nr:DUF4428 domain-containing protein [Spirochaetaceae bacterium]